MADGLAHGAARISANVDPDNDPMRHDEPLDAHATTAAYRWKIVIGATLLAATAVVLSVLAIVFKMPHAGFGAMVVTFGGLGWLSTVWLRRRFALFHQRRGAR